MTEFFIKLSVRSDTEFQFSNFRRGLKALKNLIINNCDSE